MDYPNQFNPTHSNFVHPQCTCSYHHQVSKYPEPQAHYPAMHVNTMNHPMHSYHMKANALQPQPSSITQQLSTTPNFLSDPFQISVNHVNNANNNNGSGSPTATNVSNTYSSLSTISSDNASSDNYYATDMNGGYNCNAAYNNNREQPPHYGEFAANNEPWVAHTNAYDAVSNGYTVNNIIAANNAFNPFSATDISNRQQPPYHHNGYSAPYQTAATTLRPPTPDYFNGTQKALQYANQSVIRNMEDTKLFVNSATMKSPNYAANDMKPITKQQQVPPPTITPTTTTTTPPGAHQCTICGKRFKHKCNLKIHCIIHTPAALQCSFCHKRFARNSNLNEHTKIHTNFRPFKCQFCHKTFRQKQTLIDHIRTHTGERPFKCDFCNKAFKVKHNLKSHRRLHTGERPFICPLCPKKFASKSSLNGHIRRKHTEYWTNRHRTNCR